LYLHFPLNNQMRMKLSPLIAGCMKWGSWGAGFTTPQYREMIAFCMEHGITSFDHADIYGHYTTEEAFGKAMAAFSSRRQEMQLITKCGIRMVSPNRPDYNIKSYDSSAAHIIASAELSLRNLQTDYIDLFLIHRPSPLMNPYEIATAITRLKEQGKILHFGVSNFTPSQVSLIGSAIPVVANQTEISLLHLSPFIDGTLDQCITQKMIPMAWSPLGGGNIFVSADERDQRIAAVANILAEKYQVKPEQILLAWLLQHPAGIVPVVGTSKMERIPVAAAALNVHMTSEEWFMLWCASTGQEVD
jgi:predicted oxidoreductase